MKKTVIAVNTLAALGLLYVTLTLGLPADSLRGYLDHTLFALVCITIIGVPAYVWLLLGLAGFGVGVRLLLASRSRGLAAIGLSLSMLPVLIIILGYFFSGYRGP